MNENPIIECFAVAENKLLDAIDRQRSRGSDGHNNNETIGENRGKISPDIGANKFAVIDDDTMDISIDTDPDAAAAAYFAMQAKKGRDEERQNEKVFDDWATIILRQQQILDDGGGNQNPGTLFEAQESSVSLAEDLLAEFQRILRS
jgi:hypothetical protein